MVDEAYRGRAAINRDAAYYIRAVVPISYIEQCVAVDN